MADRLTIDVDTSGLLRQLDRLGARAAVYLRAASLDTGAAVAESWRGLLAGRGTGQTASNITHADATRNAGLGVDVPSPYVEVFARAVRRPQNLLLWLQFGTRRAQGRYDLLGAAAAHESAHRARIQAALDRAVADAERG